MWDTRVWSLGRKDPLEKEMATPSSILAWEIPWTGEPGRLQSMGLQRVRHDWVTSLSGLFLSGFSFLSFWPVQLVGSYLPDYESNPHPLHGKHGVLNHWTARGVHYVDFFFSILTVFNESCRQDDFILASSQLFLPYICPFPFLLGEIWLYVPGSFCGLCPVLVWW